MDEAQEKEAAKQARESVQGALQANPPSRFAVEGALVTGWSLVAEWMRSDGSKWLARLDAEDTTKWQREGMFFEALWDWDDEEDED